jgi:hypothetical protein
VCFKRLLGHQTGFLKRAPGGDAARKIREIDTEIAVGILAKERDVSRQRLPPEFHARLPLDTLDRANRHILSGMRNGHNLLRLWMHEVVVTSGRREVDPSGITQLPDDRPTIYRMDDAGPRHMRQAGRDLEARS